jgi:hypothetical protein|tara:strand:- start:14780 stop:15430 length:651 start_codon:yes stop_codon:yes gene_type:complete
VSIASKIAGIALPPPLNWLVTGLGWIWDLIIKFIRWAIANPWQAACLIMALWLVFLHVHTMPAKDRETAVQSGAKNIAARWFVDERRAFNAFIIKVELARKVAAELDRRNAVRFKQETEARISEIENENIELRDRNRSLVAERLRGPGVRAASVGVSGGGTADLPILSAMPGGIVQGSGAAIISESDALICADNYSTLTSLIAAWKAVEKIDVNQE